MKIINESKISNIQIASFILFIIVIILIILLLVIFIKNSINKKRGELHEYYLQKVLKKAKLDKAQLQKIAIEEIKKEINESKNDEIQRLKNISEKEINKYLERIIISGFESVKSNIIKHTYESLKIDENKKGQIIGKNRHNLKSFEEVTSCKLLVEKEENVKVSCLNPYKRALGLKLLKRLIQEKFVDETKIKSLYHEICQKNEVINYENGKKVVENLQIEKYVPDTIYAYIGKLKYRTSYQQNVLDHVIECAKIASNIAKGLNLDDEKAKAAALLHDIGKAIDFEEGNNHVWSGVKIAKENNLDEFIVNAIEAHHSDVAITNIYSVITKVVDAISAGRPGARCFSAKDFYSKINNFNLKIKSFYGVKDVYIMYGKKQIKVVLDATKTHDEDMDKLSIKIKNDIANMYNVDVGTVDLVIVREKISAYKINIGKNNENSNIA